jgi:hypothetical protein
MGTGISRASTSGQSPINIKRATLEEAGNYIAFAGDVG